jgi:hypothetical protein
MKSGDDGNGSEKQSFDRIQDMLARRWDSFQAAFFLLQDEDEYFKVGKVGFQRLLNKFSIPCSSAELQMLWRKLTPVSVINLKEGKGGGIDYFDLIRVFGPNHNRPARCKIPGAEGASKRAGAVDGS